MIQTSDLISKFEFALANHWGYIWGTKGLFVWTAERQKAATRDMTVKYGSRWIGHTVADCSGLFWWAFNQLGGYMYHGSNTMYNSYCTAKGKLSKGKRTDGKDLIPGTAVFTGTEGNHGHVGLYIGDGGVVIEAKGTQAGVVKSKITDSRWTYWGELKGGDYGSSPSPEPTKKPTLRRGDTGEFVTLAQTELIHKGYSCGSFGADGQFGAATESAVRSFQKDHGLTNDGVIGEKTWAALDAAEDPVKYTVTIPHLSKSQTDALIRQYPESVIMEERG